MHAMHSLPKIIKRREASLKSSMIKRNDILVPCFRYADVLFSRPSSLIRIIHLYKCKKNEVSDTLATTIHNFFPRGSFPCSRLRRRGGCPGREPRNTLSVCLQYDEILLHLPQSLDQKKASGQLSRTIGSLGWANYVDPYNAI